MGRRRARSFHSGDPLRPARPDAAGEPITTSSLGARLRTTRRGRGRRRGGTGGRRLAERPETVGSRREPSTGPERTETSDRTAPTGRYWVPGTDSGPGTLVVLPDARRGLWSRCLRWAALIVFFLAGGALGTLAFPWVETAVGRAADEARSVAEAGFLHGSGEVSPEGPRP